MNHPRPPRPPRASRTLSPARKAPVWSLMLASVVIVAAPLCLLVWAVFQVWGNEDVESSQPIGNLVHMSPTGNGSGSVVIQTDQGFLPLHKAVAIRTGTPLVLEVRATGRRYVCDRARTLCVETSKEGFTIEAANAAGGRP